jgi:tetratricopeptide (TPR) repeat protein
VSSLYSCVPAGLDALYNASSGVKKYYLDYLILRGKENFMRNTPEFYRGKAVHIKINTAMFLLFKRNINLSKNRNVLAMKIGQFIHILAILLLIIGFIPPILAAENETGDAATAFYNSGELLLQSKEYARAIEAFDQALASNTTMIRWSDALLYTYRDKGYALIQLNNYTEAIRTFDQGLAIYENDEMLWYNKGFALFKLGNYPDAIIAYNKVLQINNQSVPALNNMGDTYFQMGRYQDAVNSYKRANTIEPNDSYSIAGLANAQSAAASRTDPYEVGKVFGTTVIPLLLGVGVALLAIYFFSKKKGDEKKAEKKPKEKKK